MPHSLITVVYRLSADDCLIAFNADWDVFAEQNSSLTILGKQIANRSIWDFISDAETKHLHKSILKKVRLSNTELTVPFRCDAPGMRRYMEMKVIPLGNGEIEYQCKTIRVESAPQLACATELADASPLLRMCSWCNKIEVTTNTWLEIDVAVGMLDLFSQAQLPWLTHTMCNSCLETLGPMNEDEGD